MFARAAAVIVKTSPRARKGNPFLKACPGFGIVKPLTRELTVGTVEHAIALWTEQRSVPAQDGFAKKHPGECAEC